MTWPGLLSLVAAALAAATGCAPDATSSTSQPGGTGDTGDAGTGSSGGTSDSPLSWRALITSTNAGYPIGGTAIVRMGVDDRAFIAVVEIHDDQWGAVRGWHVRAGGCSTGGTVIGDEEWYPPLATDHGGDARVETAIPLPLDPTGEYHVAVLRTESASSQPIGCGPLQLQ